jgi:hypothetical protein
MTFLAKTINLMKKVLNMRPHMTKMKMTYCFRFFFAKDSRWTRLLLPTPLIRSPHSAIC